MLHRSGDAFVSLGRIAVHVKSRVDRRLTTMEIGKRLETCARLEPVESSPEETDAYRMTVRPHLPGSSLPAATGPSWWPTCCRWCSTLGIRSLHATRALTPGWRSSESL